MHASTYGAALKRRGPIVTMLAVVALIAVGCGEKLPPEVVAAREAFDEASAKSENNQALRDIIVGVAADYPALPEAQAAVEAALGSGDTVQQMAGMSAVESWADAGWAAKIEPLLASDSQLVKRTAARLLADLGSSAGVDVLRDSIREQGGALDLLTCDALLNIEDGACLEEALSDLSSKDEAVMQSAAIVLGDVGGEQALEALRAALKKRRGEQRAPIISALGEAGTAEDVAALIPYARFRENVREVIGALGSLGGAEATEKLSEYLDSEDPVARAEAAIATLRAGGDAARALAALGDVPDSDKVALRNTVATSLEGVGGAGDVLRSLAIDSEPVVRRSALNALADSVTAADLPTLASAWDLSKGASEGPGYDSAMIALRLASRFDGEEATTLLQQGIDSDNWAHAIQASMGLLERHARTNPG